MKLSFYLPIFYLKGSSYARLTSEEEVGKSKRKQVCKNFPKKGKI